MNNLTPNCRARIEKMRIQNAIRHKMRELNKHETNIYNSNQYNITFSLETRNHDFFEPEIDEKYSSTESFENLYQKTLLSLTALITP